MHWSAGADTNAVTVTHWGYSGGAPSAADLTTVGTAIRASTLAHLQTLLSSNWAWNSVDLEDIASTTGAGSTFANQIIGTRSGQVNPESVAVLINCHIVQRYRGGKPRMYLPLGVAADQSGNIWTSGFVSTVTAAVQAWTNAIVGTAMSGGAITDQRAVSYYQGVLPPTTLPSGRVKQANAKRATPATYSFTTVTCNPIPGNQRRRLRF